MLEFWLTDAEDLVAYVNAAQLFSYEYYIERKIGEKSWHIVIYTDKFRAAAAKAASQA